MRLLFWCPGKGSGERLIEIPRVSKAKGESGHGGPHYLPRHRPQPHGRIGSKG